MQTNRPAIAVAIKFIEGIRANTEAQVLELQELSFPIDKSVWDALDNLRKYNDEWFNSPENSLQTVVALPLVAAEAAHCYVTLLRIKACLQAGVTLEDFQQDTLTILKEGVPEDEITTRPDSEDSARVLQFNKR